MKMEKKMSDTKTVVKKLVSSVADANGYAYTAGYLESLLVEIIERNVKDKDKLQLLHVELLMKAIDAKLDKMAA
jgi:hypothetical protein